MLGVPVGVGFIRMRHGEEGLGAKRRKQNSFVQSSLPLPPQCASNGSGTRLWLELGIHPGAMVDVGAAVGLDCCGKVEISPRDIGRIALYCAICAASISRETSTSSSSTSMSNVTITDPGSLAFPLTFTTPRLGFREVLPVILILRMVFTFRMILGCLSNGLARLFACNVSKFINAEPRIVPRSAKKFSSFGV